MSKYDLNGLTFGRWTVLYENGRTKNRRVIWHCVCECGKEKDVSSTCLISGESRSCGCLCSEIITLDLVGKIFGKLTVIKRAEKPKNCKTDGSYWLCQCECGKTKIVLGTSLQNNSTKSCGCLKKENMSKEFLDHQQKQEDIIGQKFGRLTVIRDIENEKRSLCLCKCECGKEITTRKDALKAGRTISCGCYHKEKLKKGKTSEEVLIRNIFNSYKNNAKKRKICFELNSEDFESIIRKKCAYCGRDWSNKRISNYDQDIYFLYNGIDRVDSKKGYILDNCVPCCSTCNMAKSSMALDEFFSWVSCVYNFSIVKIGKNK